MTVKDIRLLYGSAYDSLSDDEIVDMDNKLSSLVGSLLDTYERSIFDGQTIQELANHHEK